MLTKKKKLWYLWPRRPVKTPSNHFIRLTWNDQMAYLPTYLPTCMHMCTLPHCPPPKPPVTRPTALNQVPERRAAPGCRNGSVSDLKPQWSIKIYHCFSLLRADFTSIESLSLSGVVDKIIGGSDDHTLVLFCFALIFLSFPSFCNFCSPVTSYLTVSHCSQY